MRQGKLLVRLSDLLEAAPASVLQAIAHILLAKMYRVRLTVKCGPLSPLRIQPPHQPESPPGAPDARTQTPRLSPGPQL